jgi:L,D-transpeptidase ErfK/SrfK
MTPRRRSALLAAILVAAAVRSAPAWQESDFTPRPVVAYPYSLDFDRPSTVIGEAEGYTFQKGDTIFDVARHLGLGINEAVGALPGFDVWIPPPSARVVFPTWWVLPDAEHDGIVVNIPEMRLYYYPRIEGTGPRTVITYPVGLGRDDWRTPTGTFKVVEKTVDPTWIIPDSIREEHIIERGDTRKMIPGGDPTNPLGHYRLRLSPGLYGIHGTNIPWGVGMEVSHGCIRLYPEDIEQLFQMVPVGTRTEIVYQPVKLGARDGEIYVEVHPDIYDTGFDGREFSRRWLWARGWAEMVDYDKLDDALDRQDGVPTRISDGRPVDPRRGQAPPAP